MGRFERYVAFRYLRGATGRNESRRFLRFITSVAIGGVAVGVAALLLALAIVRGFSREIEAKIVGFGAHVQVESIADRPIKGAGALAADLAARPHVAEVWPVVEEFTLLRRSSEAIDGVKLVGVEALPSYLAAHMNRGAATFRPDDMGHPGLVIGSALASVLGVSVGERVTAFSMRDAGELAGEGARLRSFPKVKQFVVTGIYETSFANFDEVFVFCPLDVARSLLDYGPDEVTRFDLTLDDVAAADSVSARINEELGFPIMSRTIYEVYHSYFAWVNLQQSIIPLVIGIIILVAAFNILATLLMIILEKTREVGVLVSLGASAKLLRRLYLWLGLMIGSVGVVIGEVAAFVLAWLQQRYGLIPLPADAYYMKTAPIELNGLDFVIVGALAVLLCLLAAYVPARVASRIEPIRAIRFR